MGWEDTSIRGIKADAAMTCSCSLLVPGARHYPRTGQRASSRADRRIHLPCGVILGGLAACLPCIDTVHQAELNPCSRLHLVPDQPQSITADPSPTRVMTRTSTFQVTGGRPRKMTRPSIRETPIPGPRPDTTISEAPSRMSLDTPGRRDSAT